MGASPLISAERSDLEEAVSAALRLAGDATRVRWLEATPDAILLLEPASLTLLGASAAAGRLLPGASQGTSLEALLDREPLELVRDLAAGLVSAPRGQVRSATCRLRAGDERPLQLGAGALLAEDGPRLLCLLRPCEPASRLPPDGALRRGLARYGIAAAPWDLDVKTGRLEAAPCFEGQHTPLDLEGWLTQLCAEDRQRVQLELKTVLCGLSTHLESEYRMTWRDGSERWMRLQARLELGGDNLVGHQRPITDARELAAALDRSEARFRQLLARSPDALMVPRAGRLVHVNRAMLDALGCQLEAELLDEPLLRYVHPDDLDAFCAQVVGVTGDREGSGRTVELRLLRPDGGAVAVEAVSLKLDFDGQPAVLTLARDVTARRKLQARVAHADRMVSLGTLAAGVAHEINNPLTFLQINLSSVAAELTGLFQRLVVLEERAGMADRRSHGELEDLEKRMEEALYGARRIQEIVSDLKTFTHPNDESSAAVDLRRVLELALNLARHELKYRATVETDLGAGALVCGQEGRLCQVFLNLLINAAQAIEVGDVTANLIQVTLEEDGEQAVVRITDTGVGVPPEHLDQLYDPFFTTKAPGVGSGMGLSICRHIVEDSGGEIHIDSAPSRGTSVTVRLPLAEPTMEVENPAELDEAPTQAPAPGPRRRLLLIDDEPELCRAIRRALTGEYSVSIAPGGREAIEILAGDPGGFDAVLCDIMMPEVTGLDVMAWVRANQPEVAERVVFITGGAIGDRARRFVEEVDNFVLEKPLDLRNLKRLLRRLVPPEPARTRRLKPGPRGWEARIAAWSSRRSHSISSSGGHSWAEGGPSSRH